MQPFIFDHPVTPEREAELLRAVERFPAIGTGAAVFGAAREQGAPTNLYQVRSRKGDFICKVKAVQDAERLLLTERILDFLSHSNADVVVPLADRNGRLFPEFSPGFVLECTPLVPGTLCRGTAGELRLLGSALAELHECLRGLPFAEKVRALNARWEMRMESGKAALCNGRAVGLHPALDSWLVAHDEYLKRLCRDWIAMKDIPGVAQPVHGDMNSGNALFEDSMRKPRLIDFEDAGFASFPPCMELAFVTQRFCLFDNPVQAVALDRLRALLQGYGHIPEGLEILPRLWRLWCFRSTVRLFCRIQEGNPTFDLDEMNKFPLLEARANGYSSLVRAVLEDM